MPLKEVQEEIDKWIQLHKIAYWSPHEILARLSEETGELAREINHIFGPMNTQKRQLRLKKNSLMNLEILYLQ